MPTPRQVYLLTNFVTLSLAHGFAQGITHGLAHGTFSVVYHRQDAWQT